MTIKPSASRVRENTCAESNQRIDAMTQRSIDWFTSHPDTITQRLDELESEWDVERALETGSAALTLAGLLLAAGGNRKWLLLPAVVQGFFMQHALQGWCPPLPVLRRLGFRTTEEIDREKFALRMSRGDRDKVYSFTPETPAVETMSPEAAQAVSPEPAEAVSR